MNDELNELGELDISEIQPMLDLIMPNGNNYDIDTPPWEVTLVSPTQLVTTDGTATYLEAEEKKPSPSKVKA